ncbi:sel1 repeat family protein [Pelomyxa schiedti]|nr:sel1 repeat family protein [Pelomyxa schiedti]
MSDDARAANNTNRLTMQLQHRDTNRGCAEDPHHDAVNEVVCAIGMLARGDLAACDAWCAQIVGLNAVSVGGACSHNWHCDKRKCAAHFLTRCVCSHAPSLLSKRKPFRDVDTTTEEIQLAQACSWDSKDVLVSAVIRSAACGSHADEIEIMGGGSCDQYVGTGYYLMGVMFGKGLGVHADDAKAVEAYRISASLGHSMGQYNMGYFWENGAEKNQAEANRLWELSVAQGNPVSQVSLGYNLKYGFGGTPVDNDRAMRLWRLSAEQGNPCAQTNLALCYEKLPDPPHTKPGTNQAEAFKLFYSAAVQGYDVAQNCLGNRYMKGIHGHTDPQEAVKWLRLSASQGNPMALRNLGDYYCTDYYWTGTATRDTREAFRLYLLASSKGDQAATTFVSRISNRE